MYYIKVYENIYGEWKSYGYFEELFCTDYFQGKLDVNISTISDKQYALKYKYKAWADKMIHKIKIATIDNINLYRNSEYVYKFEGHRFWVNCLAKCNEQFFASGSNDKTIKLWDYNERKEIRTINAHNNIVECLIRQTTENTFRNKRNRRIFYETGQTNSGVHPGCLHGLRHAAGRCRGRRRDQHRLHQPR